MGVGAWVGEKRQPVQDTCVQVTAVSPEGYVPHPQGWETWMFLFHSHPLLAEGSSRGHRVLAAPPQLRVTGAYRNALCVYGDSLCRGDAGGIKMASIIEGRWEGRSVWSQIPGSVGREGVASESRWLLKHP